MGDLFVRPRAQQQPDAAVDAREMGQPEPGPEPEPPLSLKELTKQKYATLNSAADFAGVRQLVRDGGGAPALLAELCAKGFVDGDELTTHPLPPGPGKPYNPFARIAMGLDSQGPSKPSSRVRSLECGVLISREV